MKSRHWSSPGCVQVQLAVWLVATACLCRAADIAGPTNTVFGAGGAIKTFAANAHAVGAVTGIPGPEEDFTIEGYVFVPNDHPDIGIPGYLFVHEGVTVVQISDSPLNPGSLYGLWFGLPEGDSLTFRGPSFGRPWNEIAGGWHHLACVNDRANDEHEVRVSRSVRYPANFPPPTKPVEFYRATDVDP